MSQDFIKIIEERGFVHQFTDREGLSELLKSGRATAYIGFDCTAKSLHVGSLLQIMLLRWWQKCGNKPIVLLGGGTTKIGDPSGKDESRPPLTDADIQANMDSLKQVFAKFIEFEQEPSWVQKIIGLFATKSKKTTGTKAVMINNDDWLSKLNYAEFLRDYGRHFSVNNMLSMDSVKLRIERQQHLSFLEFNYMILQAYDFVELNKEYGCRVQMGGSDQWGNIVQGIELHRRLNVHSSWSGAPIKGANPSFLSKSESKYELDLKTFGITSPLLTTSSGAKMGKTAAGAIWLNADMLKPYDYWQYWRNTEDADVIKFLKLFTDLPLEQIKEYENWVGSAKINDAKIILATEATAMLHGREAADLAAKTAADTFSGAGVSADLPEITVPTAELKAGISVVQLLVQAGFATSNGEARRLLKGGGAKVNDAAVAEDAKIDASALKDGFIKLSAGKKRHVLVKAA